MTAAVLQLLVIVLLARGLAPNEFAVVASVGVVMAVIVAVNGFGLILQIQVKRSRDPNDPELPAMFALRLRFTYASALLWLTACLVFWLIADDQFVLALTPIALWLFTEQTSSVWNGVSIVDDRSQDLMPSYLLRRLPVVVILALALWLDWDVVWSWTIGLALGSAVGFLYFLPRQERWARELRPRIRDQHTRPRLELGYWWSEVGAQLRDMDVALLTMINAHIAGAYALPARLVKPMNLVTVAAASVAFPRIARRAQVTIRELLQGCVIGTVPVLLMAGVIALAAPLLPQLVGEEYAAAVSPLRLLCVAAVITGFGALLMTFLQARSPESARAVGYAVLLFGATQVLLAAVGGYFWGAVGASWGNIVNQLWACLVLWKLAERQCRREVESSVSNAVP